MTLKTAARAWDVKAETIEDINRRIHDGVPLTDLHKRAEGYASRIMSCLPADARPTHILEIGPGVGFIIEAMAQRLPGSGFVGLDISQSMIEKAEVRMRADAPSVNACFYCYDGVTVPLSDSSFDLIYSVAALQHVPKPYVYNLFFEIKRLLTSTGLAVIHLLRFSDIAGNEAWFPWDEEVAQQVGKPRTSDRNAHGHWHHYYAVEELTAVLGATGFTKIEIKTEAGLWARFGL
jgi:ubiquinone/menaquinone biosynthesis C-methylase UbiE